VKIVIDHDVCRHGGAFADRCLAATIRHPLGHERYCTAQVEDDGRAELTVVLRMEGHQHTLVLRCQEEVESVMAEGWPAFMTAERASAGE
jgi:hypothetical protein